MLTPPSANVAVPVAIPRDRTRRGWLSDFEFGPRRLRVRKTGAETAIDGALLLEVFKWLRYHALVRLKSAFNLLVARRGAAIWFAPDAPRPWYMIRAAAAWEGVRIARSADEADAAFHFDDSTWSPPASVGALVVLNGRCLDISKSRVTALFERAFGYSLAIDPESWRGEAVEKGEINGMHDGRIIACPTARTPGRCYQRLIDTERDGVIRDLRTPCVDGEPVLVWEKRRRPADRFASIANLSVARHAPGSIFSLDEFAAIRRFNRLIGLDWGCLDVLRDRADGRIYIVDVNKTDVGPVLNLSMGDKLASTRILGRALAAMIARRPA